MENTHLYRTSQSTGYHSYMSHNNNSFCRQCLSSFIVPRTVTILYGIHVNHYRTIGRVSGPAHYDVSIRQAARAAFVTSSFKIFLTQTFLRCGATCFKLPSRAMTQLFNGVNFVYRSVEVYLTFCSYLRVLVRIQCFYNGGRY